jgi:hypothetical protein
MIVGISYNAFNAEEHLLVCANNLAFMGAVAEACAKWGPLDVFYFSKN